ncbi:acyltransferase family protein [Rhodopseudomonas palustris]|uniref:Acyltransferase n=1 Tax=Rhodopseudomonas palustris TaxID=1076 RepID=A0A418VDA2_RHOPL|nr:acyltransferase [Rhodopseudomonas palustris]RJF74133.1 acyltransferase [Rhodopseudomonas palustris]
MGSEHPARLDRKTSTGLQAIRFLAAFGVFVHHALANAGFAKIIPGTYLESSRWTSSGVIMFFVLSGYLMAKISDQARSPLRFLADRALRVYPGLWVATGIVVLIHYSIWRTAFPPSLLIDLTLFPTSSRIAPLGVEWTLFFEAFFYCVVAALILIPRLLVRKLLVLAWAVIVLLFGGGFSTDLTIAGIALSFLNLAFIAGMFTWWLAPRLPFRGVAGVAASVGLFCAGRYLVSDHWLAAYLIQSVAFAVLITTAARSSYFDDRPLFPLLGDASYGLYLIHSPLLAVCFLFVAPGWVSFFAVSALVFAVSVGFGLAEYGFHQRLRSLRQRLPMGVRATTVSS